jgi:glycosyltransferase involved in cell wall biosynthesis
VRVLVVNWQDRENPQAGGAEIHLHEIFGRLTLKGHEVRLLCGGWPGCPPRAALDGIEVYRVGTRHSFPFGARRHYSQHLANWADILVEDINKVPLYTTRWGAPHTMALVPHLFGSTAFQELPVPLAAAVWSAERPLGRMYRGVPFEAISESTADDLQGRGIERSLIEVIYPGVDTIGYTPDPAVRSPTPVFAYLGRLKRYKGVHLVIRAFAQLNVPDAVLEIAGAGDYRSDLEELARSLNLGERVKFLGRISEPEKLALLRRSWALVFASPKEGWGITNLEAAACATPVVASNSPGIRESVRDGHTGFLVPHGDVGAMAAGMRRIAQSADLLERLGDEARAFAESFTWERAADRTEAHLQRVIAGGTR